MYKSFYVTFASDEGATLNKGRATVGADDPPPPLINAVKQRCAVRYKTAHSAHTFQFIWTAPWCWNCTEATRSHIFAHFHKHRNHGGFLVETFSTFLSGCCGQFGARTRTDAIYLYLGAQEYGLMHGFDAEQRAGGGPEDHGHATAGDRAAAKGDHHEPKGDNQGTDVQTQPLRGTDSPRSGTQREATWVQEYDGGCIPGHHGHSGPAWTDFTDAETKTGKPRGMHEGKSSRSHYRL